MLESPQILVLAGGQFVQRRISDGESAVAHRTFHMRNGMAGRACKTSTRLRSVDLLQYRLVEAPIEEHRVIVTAGTPLGRLGPGDALKIFNRLPVELVVEGREVMHRALPLVVDVLVTVPAHLRVHEEI